MHSKIQVFQIFCSPVYIHFFISFPIIYAQFYTEVPRTLSICNVHVTFLFKTCYTYHCKDKRTTLSNFKHI